MAKLWTFVSSSWMSRSILCNVRNDSCIFLVFQMATCMNGKFFINCLFLCDIKNSTNHFFPRWELEKLWKKICQKSIFKIWKTEKVQLTVTYGTNQVFHTKIKFSYIHFLKMLNTKNPGSWTLLQICGITRSIYLQNCRVFKRLKTILVE